MPSTPAEKSRRSRRYREAVRDGIYRPRVPAADVRPHVAKLYRSMTLQQIAVAADASESAIKRILTGVNKYVDPDRADRIRAIPVSNRRRHHRSGVVDALAACRMTRALTRVGYSLERQAAESGVAHSLIQSVRSGRQRWITAGNHRRIRAMYDRLPDNPADRPAQRAVDYATARDWAPPVCWDDDTISEPNTRPRYDAPRPAKTDVEPSVVELALAGASTREDLTTAEAVKVVRALVRSGWPDQRIGAHLHWGDNAAEQHRRVSKFRDHHKIPGLTGTQLGHAAIAGKQAARYMQPAA